LLDTNGKIIERVLACVTSLGIKKSRSREEFVEGGMPFITNANLFVSA
jgi:hypothetical protein